MQENGRQRAAKINRHYFTAADPFLRRKRWLSLLGIAAGLAYSAWLFSSPGALHVSTGELSQPHSAWNKTGCEKCHLANVPIRKDAFGGDTIENISKNNQQCNGMCHTVTDHFRLQTKAEVHNTESCSGCHREHLGFHRSLVEVDNQDCSRCHANMQSIAIDSTKAQQAVTSFDDPKGHPEFASLKQDPGTIRFSHTQHLRPGQPSTKEGLDAKSLEMLPDKFRGRYQSRVDGNGLIQLVCSSCHERDVALSGYESLELGQVDARAVQSSSHRQYKPIDFELHCAACHDLDGVPHGLDRVSTNLSIRDLVPRRQYEFFREQNKTNDEDSTSKMSLQQQTTEREQRLLALTGNLSGQCTKCHQAAPRDSANLVLPSNLNKTWLKNAAFSHGPHLMVSCKECHAQAFEADPDAVDSSVDSEAESKRVMISGIAKCRTCHIQDGKARAELFKSNRHAASANCVDCHRYHIDSPPKSIRSAHLSSGELHRYLVSEVSQ